MNWYYAQNGTQMGPVDEGELDGLIRRGEIIASTLVWRSGLAGWQPYSEVRPADAPVALLERPVAPRTPGPGEARCVECEKIFPADEVVHLAGADVCADCKAIFLQKLREGTPTHGRLPYAGFWIRAAAFIFDALILMPPRFYIWGRLFLHDPMIFIEDDGFGPRRLLLNLFFLAVGVTYNVWFIGRFGATPGKMICDLRVVRADGTRLTYGRALNRCFARWLSGVIFCIGYLMTAFDGEKRALHDQICDTRVIHKI